VTNLFATVLTYPAPSANYRGENELNRQIIQKVTDGRFEYAVISPEAMRNALRFTVTGVEIFQLQPRGNNIDLRSTARVPADPALIERYAAIRDRYRNPLFRAQLIRNLLAGRPWYSGFDRLFATHDRVHFVGTGAGQFAANARRYLAPAQTSLVASPDIIEEPPA
jgi:CRISPR-associated protein Cmx8